MAVSTLPTGLTTQTAGPSTFTLISGTNRTAFESISSQTEHLLATTKPSDMVDLIGLDEGGEDEL